MKFRIAMAICTTALIANMGIAQAQSGNTVKLLKKSGGNIQSIGKVPPKRKKVLNLGPLRTSNAKLPGGVRSFQDRMRLRRKRAADRRRQVDSAVRKPPKGKNSRSDI